MYKNYNRDWDWAQAQKLRPPSFNWSDSEFFGKISSKLSSACLYLVLFFHFEHYILYYIENLNLTTKCCSLFKIQYGAFSSIIIFWVFYLHFYTFS